MGQMAAADVQPIRKVPCMSDLTSTSRLTADAVLDAQPSNTQDVGHDAGWFRRVIARRSAVGISVAGLLATAILTSVAGSAPASAVAGSPGSPGQNTVTQTTSSSTGTMTVQVKDHRGRRGLKVASVTYSGTLAAAIKRPTLTIIFAPSGPPFRPPVHHRMRLRIVVFHVNLKGPLTTFSGALPARVIASVNRNGGLQGGYTLNVNLGNIIKKTRRSITARLVMQEGIVLTPIAVLIQRALH